MRSCAPSSPRLLRRARPCRGAALALAASLAALPVLAPPPAASDTAAPPGLVALPLFERPEAERLLLEARENLALGDWIGAEGALRRLAARWPGVASAHLTLARLAARRGEAEAAATRLRAAAEAGLRGAAAVAALPEFAALAAGDAWPGLAALLDAPPPPAAAPPPPPIPAPLIEGAAFVAVGAAEWSPEARAIRAYVAAPEPDALAARAARAPGPATSIAGEAARRVNLWHAEGRAAGNWGDFYENRDGDHSPLPPADFPQMIPVEHGLEAVEAGWDRGASDGLALSYGAEEAPPLIGNSSTAVVGGPLWRSMAREALTRPGGAAELWRQHASNQLFVYPEHEDHDPFFGDVFQAATPYMIVTQGSSFSDRPALQALALALAAFRPETKARLIEERLVAPTLQMLFRRAQEGIEGDAGYLSPRAHPTAFDPDRLDPIAMVEAAQALLPEEIPPQVRLSVLREDRPTPGIELFGDGLGEALFDTPGAVARAFRSTRATRSLTVSAAATRDPNARPLTFRWVLLRGDPTKVRITPLGERAEAAEITVDWHDETRTPRDGLRSTRVDIGVFADNGVALSAPAFVSVAFPPRERRAWDAAGRLQMVDYDALSLQERYADPRLWPVREWRDVYAWDEDGRPLGWRREGRGEVASFTRHGARVVRRDAEGRPVLAERMTYPMGWDDGPGRRVAPLGAGVGLVYGYDGPDDRQGVARPAAIPDPAAPPGAAAARGTDNGG